MPTFEKPGVRDFPYPQPLRDSRGDKSRAEALIVVETPPTKPVRVPTGDCEGISPKDSRDPTRSRLAVEAARRRYDAAGRDVERWDREKRSRAILGLLSDHQRRLWLAFFEGRLARPNHPMRRAWKRAERVLGS